MKKQELLEAINKVRPALQDGKIIEFAGLLIFTGERLVGYGDELSISAPLVTDFEAAIEADRFSKLVQKIEQEEIEIALEEGQLILKAGSMETGFALGEYNKESLPDLGIEQVKTWYKFPQDFSEALKFCIFSSSTDPAFGVLCNLKIEQDRILSSDNFRITEKKLAKKIAKMKENSFLIPRKIALFLGALELEKFAITESCIHYCDDTGAMFTHRQLSEEYPELDEYMAIEGKELELPKALSGALSRAEVIVSLSDDMHQVEVQIEEKLVLIKGEGSGGAWIKETVDSDYKGGNLSFVTVPEHLTQILKYTKKAIVGESAILFIGEDFRHAVWLIETEETDKDKE